jgi:hypothetical protein
VHAIVGVRAFGIARVSSVTSNGCIPFVNSTPGSPCVVGSTALLNRRFPESGRPENGDLLARSIQDIETLEDFYVRGIARRFPR